MADPGSDKSTMAKIRALNLGKIFLAGHDWGGVVAWAVAEKYPELIHKLVILNAPHIGQDPIKIETTTQMHLTLYGIAVILIGCFWGRKAWRRTCRQYLRFE